METSKTLTGEQLSDRTLFAVDPLANHLAPPANGAEQMTLDTCGLGLEMPLAHYNQPTQSWRTSEDISLWGDYKLLENLPKSGMTRSGVLYQQPVWVRLIDETASSLWPTPTTQEVEHPNTELTQTLRRKSKNGKTSHSLGLADAVRVWPTPTADDASNVNPKSNRFRGLVAAVNEPMWPTPTYGKLSGGTGGMQQIEAKYLVGEITSEERRAMRAGNGGKLNPMWVEWLMGFPLGWTDLED